MVSMRVQFKKVKKLAQKKSIESAKLDLMINKKWGFSYSDKDIDYVIDSLDYGTADVSFEDFIELMDNPNYQFAKCTKNEEVEE